MMSTIDNYLTNLNKVKTKLMPLYEEAFGNKGWLEKNLAVVFWQNTKPETFEKEGIGKATHWLYAPEIVDSKVGKSATMENGVLLSLKDANEEWIKALKAFAIKRISTVAKADFYRSLMEEMIELGRELN